MNKKSDSICGIEKFFGSDKYLFTQVGEKKGKSTVTTGKSGYLIYGPYITLSPGAYSFFVYGQAFESTPDDYIDIVSNDATKSLGKTSLSEVPGTGILGIMNISVETECQRVEVRLWVNEKTNIRFDGIEIYNGNYACDFSILNKSYAKDLDWSAVLFKSYEKFVNKHVPFFLVIPKNDEKIFIDRFNYLKNLGIIKSTPTILFEEWVLRQTGCVIPHGFSGWHIQQVIKLCFSKLGFSKHYVTCDSAQFFTKPFDYRSTFYIQDRLRTMAREEDRKSKNDLFIQVDEKCWLDGAVVNASEAFDAIDAQFGPLTEKKYHYIGCNGIFDSEICNRLEQWSYSHGYNGFCGLISYAPYEFAWYGSYITYKEPENFYPIDPDFFVPILDIYSLEKLICGDMPTTEGRYGYLFQPPASDLVDPELLYRHILNQTESAQKYNTGLTDFESTYYDWKFDYGAVREHHQEALEMENKKLKQKCADLEKRNYELTLSFAKKRNFLKWW